MQKTKAKIVTALLLAALTLTLVPIAFASTGVIIINSTSGIQPLPITPVPAGGNVSLYFGNVTFSGSQFYLLFSQDGLSQVSSGDLRYTTIFNVAAVMDLTSAPVVVADPAFPGQWIVGQGWVNGSIPSNIPGGTFYIKAFDGATTALAVTQGIPVIASLRMIPVAGAAGTTIIVNGNAFSPNALVNLSYVNQLTLAIVSIVNLTQSNALGQFNYTMNAPDVMVAPGPGDSTAPTTIFTFDAVQNGTVAHYQANYTETQRGLLQLGRPRVGSVAGNLQNATGVYGNLTSFNLTPTIVGTTISVGVGDSFRIVGNSFYPGVVSTLWDNSIDVTPTGNTANQTGYFNATFTVPTTGLGSHNITLIDSGLQKFIVFVNVVQSITMSPTSGPIGTVVTVNGFGFPSNGVPTGNVYNVTVTFGSSTTVRAWSLTDANGQFTTSFTVPTSPGGANTVTATANDTALTAASKTFTVTANFTVSPASFYANSSAAVVATGTGFDPTKAYFVAIDNQFSPFSNTTNGITATSTGGITLTFIQAGFQPGLHVIALYATSTGGSNAPAANATFTVLADASIGVNNTEVLNALTGINGTVLTILSNTAAINATVVAISGNTATLATSIGTLTTTVNAIGANVTSIKGTVATIQTTVGTIQTTVTAINASLVGISNGFATVQTSVGTLTTSLSSIGSTLTGVSGTVATISSSVGNLDTDLSAIGAKVTSIQGDTATIKTDLGTLDGKVTATDGKVATIQTSIGTLQTSVDGVKTDVNAVPGQVNIPIWIAVVLALIAAIAAIASLLLVRRKIAG
jgi:hypothetical protein